jgi:hypothetical protein
VLLIVDAVRERSRKPATGAADSRTAEEFDADYPDEPEAYQPDDAQAGAEHPEEPTTR